MPGWSTLHLKNRFIRYCLITALSFGINVGLTTFLHEVVGMAEEGAFACSLAVVLFMNFLFMRYYVYHGRAGKARSQLLMFLGSSLGFRGLEYVSFLVIHSLLGVNYQVAIVAILVPSFLVKYIYYKTFVFIDLR